MGAYGFTTRVRQSVAAQRSRSVAPSDRHQASPSQIIAITAIAIAARSATAGQLANSKWQNARTSTYLAWCQASPLFATVLPFNPNARNQARQPSRPTVATESNAIAIPPPVNPPSTRQRRPTSSINAGSATSVGLNRHSARTKPASNRLSFSRHQKNSTQIKKTTTDICPPIQVSNRNGVEDSASKKPVLRSSTLRRSVRNKSASAVI